MEYPYSTPQILTDSLFVQYGGQTGTSTVAQRQAAFVMAEEQMTEHLSAFLVPTIVSGSAWYRGGTLFETEYGHVQQVLYVQAKTVSQLNPLDTNIYTGSALIRNAEYGYIDITFPAYYAGCYNGLLYENMVVYQSNLSTGTVSGPVMLAALTIAAQVNLNEMDVSLANEGVGDVGIQSFSNQGYSEQRVKLGRNAFGSSALAQRAARLVKKLRSKPGTVL